MSKGKITEETLKDSLSNGIPMFNNHESEELQGKLHTDIELNKNYNESNLETMARMPDEVLDRYNEIKSRITN